MDRRTRSTAKRRRFNALQAVAQTEEGNGSLHLLEPLPVAKPFRTIECPPCMPMTRPEPSKPTFPQFGKLPPELRIHVWQIYRDASMQPPHPLRVRLYRGHERVNRSNRKTTHKATLRLTAMPDLGVATLSRRAMLRICRDARYEFLRSWASVLILDKGGIVRFDPDRDAVFLDIRNTHVIDDLITMRRTGVCPDFAQAIGHIGFEMVPRLPHWSFNSRPWLDPRLEFILCFPNLHSISLISFDAFDGEVDWENKDSVSWFLSRSRNHYVKFRGFPVLDGVDYKKQSAVGTRTGGGTEKHDCVICTIHKCVYVRDVLRNIEVNVIDRPELTDEENKWLAGLSYHTLLASTAQMEECIKPFQGWLRADEHTDEGDQEEREEHEEYEAGETGNDNDDDDDEEEEDEEDDDDDDDADDDEDDGDDEQDEDEDDEYGSELAYT